MTQLCNTNSQINVSLEIFLVLNIENESIFKLTKICSTETKYA